MKLVNASVLSCYIIMVFSILKNLFFLVSGISIFYIPYQCLTILKICMDCTYIGFFLEQSSLMSLFFNQEVDLSTACAISFLCAPTFQFHLVLQMKDFLLVSSFIFPKLRISKGFNCFIFNYFFSFLTFSTAYLMLYASLFSKIIYYK